MKITTAWRNPRALLHPKRRSPIASRPSLLYSTLAVTYQRVGDVTRVVATSALTGLVFYVWYVDGAYVATTSVNARDFALPAGDQARVDVLATTDPAFDPIANAPTAWPARRSLWWVRSTDSDVGHYLVEQAQGAGAYATVASVPQTPDGWALGWLSDRLLDLTSYSWRITPYDLVGNAGTARVFGPELVVRRPDAPNFTAAASGGLVTFTGAP